MDKMIRLRRKTIPVLLQNKTDDPQARRVWIGGDHPVVVQSMTTTDTADVDATLAQVYGLAMAGCEVVRVTCQDAKDAAGLPVVVPVGGEGLPQEQDVLDRVDLVVALLG